MIVIGLVGFLFIGFMFLGMPMILLVLCMDMQDESFDEVKLEKIKLDNKTNKYYDK